MFAFAALIARKDLKLAFARASGLCQSLLLGLLLIFIFSLSSAPGEKASPQTASAIFWLGSAFCQILISNQLYSGEEANGTAESLLVSPLPVQGIWLGKAAAGLLLLLMAQLVLLPALIVFLGQTITGHFCQGAVTVMAADLGMGFLGSLLGALGQGQSGRESLLSIVLFPLMLPLLLAAINLTTQSLGGLPEGSPQAWLGIAFAFDAVFCAAGLALFGFIYGGGE